MITEKSWEARNYDDYDLISRCPSFYFGDRQKVIFILYLTTTHIVSSYNKPKSPWQLRPISNNCSDHELRVKT